MTTSSMNIIGITGAAGSGKDTVADILVKNHGFVRVALADPMKRFCKGIFGFTDEQLWGESEKRDVPDKRFPRKHSWVQADGIVQLQEFGGHEFRCACCGNIDSEEEHCFLTPRFALQQLGTEWGRKMSEDVWINKTLEAATFLLSGAEKTSSPPLRPAYVAQEGVTWRSAAPHWGHPDTYFHLKGVVIPDVRFPNELNRIRAEGGRIWHRPGAGNLNPAAASHSSELSLSHVTCDWEFPWYESIGEIEAEVGRAMDWMKEK